MGIFQRLRAAVARSPTAAQVKMVTETGNGLYVYDGNLYKSDIVRACIRPKIKAVGKATPRHIRTTIGPGRQNQHADEPRPLHSPAAGRTEPVHDVADVRGENGNAVDLEQQCVCAYPAR